MREYRAEQGHHEEVAPRGTAGRTGRGAHGNDEEIENESRHDAQRQTEGGVAESAFNDIWANRAAGGPDNRQGCEKSPLSPADNHSQLLHEVQQSSDEERQLGHTTDDAGRDERVKGLVVSAVRCNPTT